MASKLPVSFAVHPVPVAVQYFTTILPAVVASPPDVEALTYCMPAGMGKMIPNTRLKVPVAAGVGRAVITPLVAVAATVEPIPRKAAGMSWISVSEDGLTAAAPPMIV